jgi:biopolymer transport protein ExbB
MWEVESIAAVRVFVETGGNVLLVIAFVTAVMWTLIIERFWYYRMGGHRAEAQRVLGIWKRRGDHASWYAHQVRRMLISETELKLTWGLSGIKTLVALCPMLGLLGTVTGMIEVFDVMAAGSGNTRGMAGGVSKATLPTMAGMVAAISGMLFSIQLERYAQNEGARVADGLEIAHGS